MTLARFAIARRYAQLIEKPAEERNSAEWAELMRLEKVVEGYDIAERRAATVDRLFSMQE